MRSARLFWRIFVAYLFVVVLCTSAVGFYAVHSARDFYVAHTENELTARARLVRCGLDYSAPLMARNLRALLGA